MKEAERNRSLRRMNWIALAIALAGTMVALVWKGSSAALGFALGAAISLFNLRFWERVAGGAGSENKPKSSGSAVLLGMRYVIAGTAIYVIVTVWQVALGAVLAGIFVAVAAVLVESLFQLFPKANPPA
jgi:hypothetical protein